MNAIHLTLKTTFGEAIVPTHTFDSPPSNLEVLIVPGGAGTRSPDLSKEIDFIHTILPSLRYLVAVCTGNAFIARAGLLDGKKATEHHKAWSWLTTQGNKAHCIVCSESALGEEFREDMEYQQGLLYEIEWRRVTNPDDDDEFADIWGAQDVLPVAYRDFVDALSSQQCGRYFGHR